MLLRIARRRTAREDGFENFFQAEFVVTKSEPDLELSVYDVSGDPQEIARARTEHYAGLNLNPRGGPCFDVTDLHDGEIRRTTGNNPFFEFVRKSHRELVFSGEDDLRKFANELWEHIPERVHEVEKKRMKSYISERIEAHDAEWLRFFQGASNASKWAKFAGLSEIPNWASIEAHGVFARLRNGIVERYQKLISWIGFR